VSQRLGVPVSSAKEIMDKYFAGFPSLRAYMDASLRRSGRRATHAPKFGRIRPFPTSRPPWVPALGGRAPGDELGHPGTGATSSSPPSCALTDV